MTQWKQTSLAMQVKAADYDRFLAIQLAPPSVRPSLYAITAFSSELARIAETVSESMLGHIRLAWWREALEEIVAGKVPRNHPIVLAMAELYIIDPAIFTYAFMMIEARASDLDESLLAQESDWLSYLNATAGALHLAWAQILNPASDIAEREAIVAQAQNYAVIGLLRAIPYMRAQGFLRFPHNILNEHQVASLELNDHLKAFVKAMVERVNCNITEKLTNARLRPLKALDKLCHMQIRYIKKNKYNPYEMKNYRISAVIRVLWVGNC